MLTTVRTTRRQLIASTAAIAAAVSTRSLFAAAPPAAATPLRIQRLSWAGIRLEGPETSLFIDPWISKAAWDGAWPREIVPVTADAKRRAALITHIHNDHFDPPALKDALGEKGQVFCLDRSAAVVASKGFISRPVELFHPESFGDFVFIPVPAADGFGETQVSWILKSGGMNIIHGGDTIWHSGFDIIGRTYGPFDIAFLPSNGVVTTGGTVDTDVPKTLTPSQAVAAARLLRAKLLVPIHYGVSDDTYHEQPNAVAELTSIAAKQGMPLRVVSEGDWVVK